MNSIDIEVLGTSSNAQKNPILLELESGFAHFGPRIAIECILES